MKYTKLSISFASVAVGASLLAGVALPAFAEQGDSNREASTSMMKAGKMMEQKETAKEMKARMLASTTADRLAKKNQETITRLKPKADQEIDRRIASLNELNTRVQAMVKLSAAQKAAISTTIQTQIQVFTALKAKVDADTDFDVLKADVKSITDSYRVYALVLPQIQVIAAADRLSTTADMVASMGTKIQARIAEAQAAGKNITAAQSALADMGAKVADANVQAQSAITAIISLVPDQGDKTKAEANRAALENARKIIKTGEQDLKDARKDIEKITKALRGNLHVEMENSTTTPRSASSTDRDNH